MFNHLALHDVLSAYGPWAVMVVVMLESAGVPLPGETMVISAALYAGATGHVSIYTIVLAASCGAIIGDNIGYWLGRKLGLPLLVRYGPRINLTERRLRLGQYLFRRFGSAIVFFGRFVALLRTFAALMAGANHFSWERFLAVFAGRVYSALVPMGWAKVLSGSKAPLPLLRWLWGWWALSVSFCFYAIMRSACYRRLKQPCRGLCRWINPRAVGLRADF